MHHSYHFVHFCKKTGAVVLCAALMITAAPVSARVPDRIEEIISSMTLQEKAGQMIIADFRT